jgi:hypothetical protein
MIKLRRYFFISSLISFIVIAFLLGFFVRQTVRTNLVETAESKNVALTQAFSNFLWPRFCPLRCRISNPHPRSNATGCLVIPALYQLVEEQLNDLSVVKIKVYNLEGRDGFFDRAGSNRRKQAGQRRFPGGAVWVSGQRADSPRNV